MNNQNSFPVFSVIIPHKDSLDTLSRLLDSIPDSKEIEIIIVDNSSKSISRNDIRSEKDIKLFYSDATHYAGGARNVGVANANGKWLVFADADDFFSENAFDVFFAHKDDSADVIYFKSNSVYDDNISEQSDRHVRFNRIIDNYINGKTTEISARISFTVPWAKMIKRSLVLRKKILFDEVIAANDVFFSTLTGYYAEEFKVDTRTVYVVTNRRGSLANRQDKAALLSRYKIVLKRNKFLKEIGLGKYQGSVMYYLFMSSKMGFCSFLEFLMWAIKYKQNLFIGLKNWSNTYSEKRKYNKENSHLITK